MTSIIFRGQLLLTIHKGHGYYAGVPWVGNAKRRPAVHLRIGQGELRTKRWDGVGEATWHETFRFNVHCDGAETVTFVSHTHHPGLTHTPPPSFLTPPPPPPHPTHLIPLPPSSPCSPCPQLTTLMFDEREVAVSMFTIELSTLLSHVGPQWHQFRTPHDDALEPPTAAQTTVIRSEVLIESRWFPEGTPLPPNFLRSLSASADTARVAAAPSASPSNLPPLSHPSSLSVPGATSTSTTSPSGSPVPSSPPSASSSSPRHSRSSSLPQSTSNPSLSSLTQQGEDTLLRSLFSQANFDVSHLSLFPSSPATPSPFTPTSLASAPFVFSSHLHGRLHPDTRTFDDRNFLEHLAPLATPLELLVWGDQSVQALQLIFMVQGHRIAGTRHGVPTSSPHVMTLGVGEYVTALGCRRDDMGIKGMTVVTNRGTRRAFGGAEGGGIELGDDFVLQAPRGARVVCFIGGWNAKGINALGVCHQAVEGADTLALPTGGGARGPLTKQPTTRHI